MMMSQLTDYAVVFLLIWLLIYALALFGMSILNERRRARKNREARPQATSTYFPASTPSKLWGRRAAPRREGNPTPVLVADMDGPEWKPGACVVDRSEGGIRLTFSQPFDTGKKLRVLSRYAPDDRLWADVEVRNCRQATDGYELGCRFAYAHPLNVVLLFG
jgi:hypothetical protein